jgi:CRP-like cAMP-binding protein
MRIKTTERQQRSTASTTYAIREGHTLILDHSDRLNHACLQISEGLIRVAVSSRLAERHDAQPITLGYLQKGDVINLDLLNDSWLHLESLETTALSSCSHQQTLSPGHISLNDWTTALLVIQHIGLAEQRLQALLRLLVVRLGRRRGAWCELPLPISHERIAEMVNHTRSTVTRQLNHWRRSGLIDSVMSPEGGLRIAPQLIDAPGEGRNS